MATFPLRPRQYADQIIRLAEHDREEAYQQVPAELREWVRYYVDYYFPLLGYQARRCTDARIE